jgi:DNA polymerase III subunit delta
MEISDFFESCKNPELVYLLSGKDHYNTRKIFDFCEEQVEISARSFDWEVYELGEGRKEEIPDLINSIRTMPWISSHRWIYVRNADIAEAELLPILKAPVDTTVLILEYRKKPKKWPKLPTIETSGGKGIGWVKSRVRQEKYTIEPQAAAQLVDMVGDEPERLEGELEKLFLWDTSGRKITVDSILSMISDVRETQIFDLITALANKDRGEALRITGRLLDDGTTVHQIIPLLYWNFSRLLVARERLEKGHPFQLLLKELKIWSYRNREREVRKMSPDFLSWLLLKIREADRMSKSTSIPPRLHLEKLIVDTQRT